MPMAVRMVMARRMVVARRMIVGVIVVGMVMRLPTA